MSDYSRSSRLRALFESSLYDYEKLSGITLANHPVVEQLQKCNSAESVTALILGQAGPFTQPQGNDGRIIKSLEDAIAVLYTLSSNTALGEAVSMPFPPAKAVFAAFAVLLTVVKDVSNCRDPLVDLFESIKDCLNRLEIYGKVSPTAAMTEIIVKIMVELLSTLALATKHAKLKQPIKFVKKILGEKDLEAVLQRLDRLTLDEARSTAAHTLEVVYGLVQNMRVVMDDGRASVDNVHDALRIIQQIASDINKSKREKMEQDIRSWLSPPDPWKNHHIALESRHTGTAMWFVKGDTFLEWKKTSGPSLLLWIHGKPGSGKSVLSATIIEDINTMRDSGLASLTFFYCDFREDQKKDRRGLLSSVLVQLCHQSDLYCDLLSKFYSEHARGSQHPSDDTLCRYFKSLLELPGQPPVYLVIDALDECPNTSAMPSPREKMLALVKELINLKLPNLRICVTSRPEMDIKSALDPLTFHSISLHDERGQMEDIEKFIKSVVKTDQMMRRWKAKDKHLVINVLTQKANGMFRWVYCQIVYLRGCLPGRIRHALDELPETLDETYQRTLEEIDEVNWEFAHTLFQCVAVASRPLRVEELAEFLAFDFKAGSIPEFHEDWRLDDPLDAVLSTCSTLLSLVSGGYLNEFDEFDGAPVIQFSHFSVREFLTSTRLANEHCHVSHRYHISMTLAHTLVGQACLGMLLHLDEDITSDSLEKFSLVEYAARHWFYHARNKGVEENVEVGMKHLFDANKPHFATWVWISDPQFPDSRRRSTRPSLPRKTPLHIAAICGLLTMVEFLATEHPHDIHIRDWDMFEMTPLHHAAIQGHGEVVRFLLEHGADVNALDGGGSTPLHLSPSSEIARILLQHGADTTIKEAAGYTALYSIAEGDDDSEYAKATSLLLEYGADPKARTKSGYTPLHSASTEEVARLLIEYGADATAQDETGWTPLHGAWVGGVARVLIQGGADTTAQDHNGTTPLHRAASVGHRSPGACEGIVDVIHLLLENGADAKAQDKYGLTPLHRASTKRVVRLLVERGADVTARDNDGLTPLHWTSRQDFAEETVAHALLKHGVDVKARDKNGSTPLHGACSGKFALARIFLEHGADSRAQDDQGSTPLHVASQKGQVEIASLLLQYGANTAAVDKNGRTPLHLIKHGSNVTTKEWWQLGEPPLRLNASRFGDVAHLIIENGADLAAKDQNGSTPLHLASREGHEEVAAVLLEHGADTTAQDQDGRAPLHLASSEDVADLLMDHGADVTARDKTGSTPLHETLFADVALVLLEYGADPNARDRNGSTPLHRALSKGCIEVAKALLDYGADPTAQAEDGWTPLHLASSGGYMELVRILLECGADTDARAQDGLTPFDVAYCFGHMEIAELLLQ